MAGRPFPWTPEAELLVWCARTVVSDAHKARIRHRVQESLDWAVLIEMARYHGVTPLLYRNLAALCADLVPADTLAWIRQKTHAGALLNHSLAQELGRLCEAFDQHGVPVMPIKGATLALSAYGDVTLRDFTDMDLLIPEGALEAARAILLAQGYERKTPATESDHAEGPYHVFVKKRTLFRVDLQWVMAHEHFTFQMDRPEFWAQRMPVRLGNKMVQGLAPEELLLLLCVHGSKHAWEQLKWVCDVAELLRSHPDLDWERIFSHASAWGCRRLLSIGLALAQRVLDAPLPAGVRARYAADRPVQMLSARMPATLLADPRAGVHEQHAVALYFALKDSWWEQWRFGLVLCRDASPLVMSPPAWLPARSLLRAVSRLIRPCQRAVRSLLPAPIRAALNRWVEQGG
jgi:hypothetical protein